MSGIFGIVRFDGGPVRDDDLARMAAALDHWGRDGFTTETEGSAGFGHALTRSTPEDVHSSMPTRLGERHGLFTAEGRLDNRDEIARLLGIDTADAARMADSTLMHSAYLEWGEACARRMLGDWTLAAWSTDHHRLFLARDHHGNSSLTYYRDPASGTISFASDPRALHAVGAPRRLNELMLAQVLVAWAGFHGPTTIDLDIMRLPPAHIGIGEASGIRTRQYWDPMAITPLAPASLAEYAEGFLEVYDAAVRSRCRSTHPLAITLSGGLDSGSVAALAQRALRERGESLHAYTHVPITDTDQSAGENWFGDETVMSSTSAQFIGIHRHDLFDSSNVTPIEGLESTLRSLDQPTHAASNAFWIQDLMHRGREDGATTMLTGQCGNATVSWTGRSTESTLPGRLKNKGPRGAVGYFQPLWLQRRRELGRVRANQWSNSAINPVFAARIHLDEQIAAAVGVDPSRFAQRQTPLEQRAAFLHPGGSRTGDTWAANSAYYGIDVRDPTADARVIEYTFAVPDSAYYDDEGHDRLLVRAAMAGLMPDAVLHNQERGRQAADLVERLRRSADEVEAGLREVEAGSGSQYVSTVRLRDAWLAAQRSNDPDSTHRAGAVLLRGLQAGLWVSRTHP